MERAEHRELRFNPGYFACKAVIERLKRFQDLIRHHRGWAHQIEFARPIEQLIPADTPPQHRHTVIQREINQLLPLIAGDLHMVGISTVANWKELEDAWDYDRPDRYEMKEHKADVILNYFGLRNERGSAAFFDMQLGLADQAIGVYSVMQEQALRRKYKPLAWIAYIISIPVRVLIGAGLIPPYREADSKLLDWILRVIKVAWVAGIGLLSKAAADGQWIQRVWHHVFG